jgi:hypothetical protein
MEGTTPKTTKRGPKRQPKGRSEAPPNLPLMKFEDTDMKKAARVWEEKLDTYTDTQSMVYDGLHRTNDMKTCAKMLEKFNGDLEKALLYYDHPTSQRVFQILVRYAMGGFDASSSAPPPRRHAFDAPEDQ